MINSALKPKPQNQQKKKKTEIRSANAWIWSIKSMYMTWKKKKAMNVSFILLSNPKKKTQNVEWQTQWTLLNSSLSRTENNMHIYTYINPFFSFNKIAINFFFFLFFFFCFLIKEGSSFHAFTATLCFL